MQNLSHFDVLLKPCPDMHAKFNFTALSQSNATNAIMPLLEAWKACQQRLNAATDEPTVPRSKTLAASLPRSHPSALTAYFIAVSVFGLAINLCVIATICRVRRLWTITNAFVVSLAIADLFMASILVPLNVKYKYYPSNSVSIALDTLFPLLGVASLLNLAAVTLERFLSISYPFTYEAQLNRRRVSIVIAVVWMLSVFQALVQFALKTESEMILYEDLRFAFAFGLPFLCILVVNLRIYCVARHHARQILASNPQTRDNNSNRTFFKKMKTVKIIGLLVGTFMITWLPYFVLSIAEPHNADNSTEAYDVAKRVTEALVCGTALLNPLLYGFLRRDVREATIVLLKCRNINQTDIQSISYTGKTAATS